jgi:hypothetical protein
MSKLFRIHKSSQRKFSEKNSFPDLFFEKLHQFIPIFIKNILTISGFLPRLRSRGWERSACQKALSDSASNISPLSNTAQANEYSPGFNGKHSDFGQ